MSDRPKLILVPTDFTKVADSALDHALKMAARMGAEVHLLHIVPNDADELDLARTKLEMELSRVKKMNTSVVVKTAARIGNVYDDIGAAAQELQADLIIMGTHGMRGMQFITGSRALRVITNSSVPFIVVQERPIRANGYHDIVVPLDLRRETRQEVVFVADVAHYFNSKVHVITPKETDEFLHRELENSLQFARKYFAERNIAFETTVADADSGDFVDAVLRYSKNIDADLIAVMNFAKENIFGVLGVPYEQEIITNEGMIPVMIMNARQTTTGEGGWSFQ